MRYWRLLLLRLFAVATGLYLQSAIAQEAVEKSSAEISAEPEESPAAGTANKTEEEPTKEKSSRRASSETLQDMMTADEFKAAGLDKLSEEELKNLNGWLQGYRHSTATKAAVPRCRLNAMSLINSP